MKSIRSTCIINNFNYQNFIVEAVRSAINQSVPFDEIIVVDDCSTDNSASILYEEFKDVANLKLILKEKNEGQLSCFNLGYLEASGDLIFFLDSDDFYHCRYHELALTVYTQYNQCEFLAGKCFKFSGDSGRYFEESNIDNLVKPDFDIQDRIPQSGKAEEYVRDLGYSRVLSKFHHKFIGSETSGISVRRNIIGKVLPYLHLEDWRTRADDVLVFGTSCVGARKFSLNLPLIAYRLHSSNNYAGNRSQADAAVYYRRQVAINRLFSSLLKDMNSRDDLAELAPFELKTLSQPDWETFLMYLEIILNSKIFFARKFNLSLILLKHMLAS